MGSVTAASAAGFCRYFAHTVVHRLQQSRGTGSRLSGIHSVYLGCIVWLAFFAEPVSAGTLLGTALIITGCIVSTRKAKASHLGLHSRNA